jgi:fructose-1-phosphate kinase PfkB-like protein
VVAVLGGHAGAWYRAALEERSIGLHEVPVDGETRTCTSVLDESTGELTELYEAGMQLGDDDWSRVEDALRRRSASAADGRGARGQPPPGSGRRVRAPRAIAAAAGARAAVDSEGRRSPPPSRSARGW